MFISYKHESFYNNLIFNKHQEFFSVTESYNFLITIFTQFTSISFIPKVINFTFFSRLDTQIHLVSSMCFNVEDD